MLLSDSAACSAKLTDALIVPETGGGELFQKRFSRHFALDGHLHHFPLSRHAHGLAQSAFVCAARVFPAGLLRLAGGKGGEGRDAVRL